MGSVLHPALQSWFDERFSRYTQIQREALPHTLRGENTLILAPTGSGKTLSAFLSGLSALGHAPELPNAVCVVYISPLRSLGRDIFRNLTPLLQALNKDRPEKKQVRMEVRTGDTDLSQRGKQQRRRPHLLLTTPESLSALLSQTGWKDGFAPFCVILDEIHAFAESKRGSLLSLVVERLEMRAPQQLQRIGLSATAAPVSAVQRLLCGDRPCAVAQVSLQKTFSLSIALSKTGRYLPAAGFNPYSVAPVVADLVKQAKTTLVFTSTRSAAERLGLALKVLLPDEEDLIGVHHGSVDREARDRIEAGLATGEMRAVVASTSLELGVDYPAVDQVLLIGAPRGVSRTLQRLGRSGHRVDGVARGSLIPLNAVDLMECIALQSASAAGKLDQLRVPRAPLDVLAQVLLGMSIERRWTLDEAYALICRSGPYRDLPRAQFDLVIDYLSGGGKVLGPYGTFGKLTVENGSFTVASRKIAREYYLNIGTISDDFQIRVLLKGKRQLGSVEESFLSSLQPGEAFVIAGRPVVLETMHQNTALVKPAEGQRVQTPRWGGNKIPLTVELAREELRLRRDLRHAIAAGGLEEASRVLTGPWKVRPEIASQVLRFLARQQRAAPIPIDDPVQCELTPDGRALIAQFHVLAGRAVNRSLAWVLAHRLGRSLSVAANFDDHSFLLSFNARQAPTEADLRAAFNPVFLQEDLQQVVESTETLGRNFRSVAEIGQLLPRRTTRGNLSARTASWNGSLLYNTLRRYEPEHPLVREAVREVVEDQLDGERAEAESARIFAATWEVFRLPRPSPFALPLFVSFNRETLVAQDPEKALDEFVASLYDQWDEVAAPVG